MAQYTRKPGDKAYRKVSITAAGTPRFTDFVVSGELISYPDVAVVLEVLRDDGTTKLYYDRDPAPASCKAITMDTFCISQGVPTERLWIRRSDGTGIPYKVPSGLKLQNGLPVFQVPCGTANMEVCGDQYFEKVYSGFPVLIRK